MKSAKGACFDALPYIICNQGFFFQLKILSIWTSILNMELNSGVQSNIASNDSYAFAVQTKTI